MKPRKQITRKRIWADCDRENRPKCPTLANIVKLDMGQLFAYRRKEGAMREKKKLKKQQAIILKRGSYKGKKI